MFAPIPAAAADHTVLVSRSGDTLYVLQDANLPTGGYARMHVYCANPNTGGWMLTNRNARINAGRVLRNIEENLWTVAPR